jgi:hypothetical protein
MGRKISIFRLSLFYVPRNIPDRSALHDGFSPMLRTAAEMPLFLFS